MNAEQARERSAAVKQSKQEVAQEVQSEINNFKTSVAWVEAVRQICHEIDRDCSDAGAMLSEVAPEEERLLRLSLESEGYRVKKMGNRLVAIWRDT